MVAVLIVNAGDSRAARPGERKVRTPESNVPDNVREGGVKAARRKVPQKTYRLGFGRGKGEKVR
jgi:hypothetical protein